MTQLPGPDHYRRLLDTDRPQFLDVVANPWVAVPDLETFNSRAYRRLASMLRQLSAEQQALHESGPDMLPNARGALVLGPGGSGKTHLLMRVRRSESGASHILFVRRPNNPDSVAQHVWTNVVASLARRVDRSSSQLEDLLAHVFAAILIPELESDIEHAKANEKKLPEREAWKDMLEQDPVAFPDKLRNRKDRRDSINFLRRKILKALKLRHPDVDQPLTEALITYFFTDEDRRRIIYTWLTSPSITPTEARYLSFPEARVPAEFDTPTGQEEYAFRSIQTLGILSTYYKPLVLAFDQLEGLKNEPRLTEKWGDAVKEIMTMTPNVLIVTCIFPELWSTWFAETLDDAAKHRIGQRKLELEPFGHEHAAELLQVHLADHVKRHALPSPTYPFNQAIIADLCRGCTLPRVFLQRAREWFEDWVEGFVDRPGEIEGPPTEDLSPIDENAATEAEDSPSDEGEVSASAKATNAGPDIEPTQQPREEATESAEPTPDDDELIVRRVLIDRFNKIRSEHERGFWNRGASEVDAMGRARLIALSLLRTRTWVPEPGKATFGTRVMPSNLILAPEGTQEQLCIAAMYSSGSALIARARNFDEVHAEKQQFSKAIVLRDARLDVPAGVARSCVDRMIQHGAHLVVVDAREDALINAAYDLIVEAEQHDLLANGQAIQPAEVAELLVSSGMLAKSKLMALMTRLLAPLLDSSA